MKTSSLHVRRITICAVLLSISLVLKTSFSFYIPMFGQNGMSIGISGIFSMLPSLLFGPVYGAIVSGLSDFLGYVLKPVGAYLPLMSLVVASGGYIRGALWAGLQNKSSRSMRTVITVSSFILLLIGFCNIYFLHLDGIDSEFYHRVSIEAVQTNDMHMIGKMLIARTISTKDPSGNLATYIICTTSGVIASGLLDLFLLLADFFISSKTSQGTHLSRIPQLLIAMITSGLIVTTLNTIILRETIFPAWKILPFFVVWIPRAIEEILGNTVKAYFVAVLLGVFKKQPGLRDI